MKTHGIKRYCLSISRQFKTHVMPIEFTEVFEFKDNKPTKTVVIKLSLLFPRANSYIRFAAVDRIPKGAELMAKYPLEYDLVSQAFILARTNMDCSLKLVALPIEE